MKKLLLLICLFISGCYSFNSISVDPATGKISPKLTKGLIDEVGPVATTLAVQKEATVVSGVEPKTELVCRPYVLPDIPKTPELPMKELLRLIAVSDAEGVDALQVKHIDELRAYIFKVKKDLRDSHNDYLKKCYTSAGLRPPTVD
jgi:hypothetical protein